MTDVAWIAFYGIGIVSFLAMLLNAIAVGATVGDGEMPVTKLINFLAWAAVFVAFLYLA